MTNTFTFKLLYRVSQVVPVVKNLSANAGDIRVTGLIPGLGRSLEKGTAALCSILAWRVPWTVKT